MVGEELDDGAFEERGHVSSEESKQDLLLHIVDYILMLLVHLKSSFDSFRSELDVLE